MSTKEKLIDRFLSMPTDFTYGELVRLFRLFGFVESQKGRTSGSRVEFVSLDEGKTFMMHKPHPANRIKSYAMKQVLEYLSRNSDILKDKNK